LGSLPLLPVLVFFHNFGVELPLSFSAPKLLPSFFFLACITRPSEWFGVETTPNQPRVFPPSLSAPETALPFFPFFFSFFFFVLLFFAASVFAFGVVKYLPSWARSPSGALSFFHHASEASFSLMTPHVEFLATQSCASRCLFFFHTDNPTSKNGFLLYDEGLVRTSSQEHDLPGGKKALFCSCTHRRTGPSFSFPLASRAHRCVSAPFFSHPAFTLALLPLFPHIFFLNFRTACRSAGSG